MKPNQGAKNQGAPSLKNFMLRPPRFLPSPSPSSLRAEKRGGEESEEERARALVRAFWGSILKGFLYIQLQEGAAVPSTHVLRAVYRD